MEAHTTPLSQNFTIGEACMSRTAVEAGIDNSIPADLLSVVQTTAQFMEEIRYFLGSHPIIVTSWYRCLDLESLITKQKLVSKTAGTGHHPAGLAVDFICPKAGSPFSIALKLAKNVDKLGIGQLLLEYGSWIHVSRGYISTPINRVLTRTTQGWHQGIIDHVK